MAKYRPSLRVILELPEILDPQRSAAYMRVHAKVVKESLRKVLLDHHKHRMPGHFSREARSKYRHKERTDKTKAKKKRYYHSYLDLVKTGKTRSAFRSGYYRLNVGGSFTSQGNVRRGIAGTLWYKMQFESSRDNPPWQVTMKQMATELSTVTDREANEMAVVFRHAFVTGINQEIKLGTKIRKRIEEAGHYLGD